MSKRTPSVLSSSHPCDAAVPINSVVTWSLTNVGNVTITTVVGSIKIAGVAEDGSNQSSTSPPNFYAKVTKFGIVQCRALTGTAIAHGDKLKIADTAGRVTSCVAAAAGAGTLTGIVGIAQSAVASGDATDTLVDVMLTPGLQMYV